MFDSKKIEARDKAQFYSQLDREIEALMDRAWFTNLASTSAALMSQLPDINWAGFYLSAGGELLLGPFQGLPACLRIPFGKGVCGTAAEMRKTQLVADVHLFPGHIACDARSRSEIVIPLLLGDRLLGVLDVDAPIEGRFDAEDQTGLQRIVQTLLRKTDWPKEFII
jgi:L-methionine (R)-S-oxide reductase